jgi:hypothetical protein
MLHQTEKESEKSRKFKEEENKQDVFLLIGIKKNCEGKRAEAGNMKVHVDKQYLHPGAKGTVAALKLWWEESIDWALVRKGAAECTVCPKNTGKVWNCYKSELIVEDESFRDFLSADLLGPMTLGQARTYIIVIVDRYS